MLSYVDHNKETNEDAAHIKHEDTRSAHKFFLTEILKETSR